MKKLEPVVITEDDALDTILRTLDHVKDLSEHVDDLIENPGGVLIDTTSKESTTAEETDKFIEDRISMALDYYNNQLFSALVEKFNYKQRYQYQISEMKVILIPVKSGEYDYKLDVVAFAKDPKSKDKRLFSTHIKNDWESLPKEMTDILTTIMRYGLKELYLKAEEIKEDAYL